MQYSKWITTIACNMAALGVSLALSGCSGELPASQPSCGPGDLAQESSGIIMETLPEADYEDYEDWKKPGAEGETGENPEGVPGGFAGPGAGSVPEEIGPGAFSYRDKNVQSRILIATDIHYLADQLADGNCESFMNMARKDDGRAIPYLWEITDAFFEQVEAVRPDYLILSGDLTMEGEKLSHEILAERLEALEETGIQVLVIPGNHDINNTAARGYEENRVYPAAVVSAEEFAEIYGSCGYEEAEVRDPYSLSYVYRLDDYFQFLMLDTCQYDPVNLVGGVIQNETYDWVEDVLEESWELGIRTIPVTHHNLLDQSGVSRAFFDNCTIMHDEKLIELFEDNDIRLHLSGHLHIQHYRQDEEDGICEVVTGSLLMDPFQYGVIDILRDGDIHYYNQQVELDEEIRGYGQDFMRQVNYGKAFTELSQRVKNGDISLTDEEMVSMASYYAVLCEHYYGGTMYEILDRAKGDPSYDRWMELDFISETSTFLDNILEDPAYNYTDVLIKY